MNIQEEILSEAIRRYPKDLNSHEKFIEGAKWAAEVYLRNAELKMLQEESDKVESRLGKEALLNYLNDKLEE